MSTDTGTMTREFDGAENSCVAAELEQDIIAPGTPWAIRLITDPHCFPNAKARLDPATARVLAQHLIDLAEEADARNPEPVQLACRECGEPIHWSAGNVLWYHDTTPAILACPAAVVEPAGE